MQYTVRLATDAESPLLATTNLRVGFLVSNGVKIGLAVAGERGATYHGRVSQSMRR